MDEFNDGFLRFSKGERVAIISLAAAIVILIVLSIWKPFHQEARPYGFHALDSLIAARQNAMDVQTEKPTSEVVADEPHLTPFPFNPNGLPEEEWRKMGLTDRQIRTIKNYEAKGGKFYSKNDVKKMYSISDEEFAELEPFIVIPPMNRSIYDHSNRQYDDKGNVEKESKPTETKVIAMVEINAADSALFGQLPKVSPYLAARIVTYRNKLGGFLNLEQLLEVKGMDSVHYQAVLPYLQFQSVETKKVDINRDDFKTLVNHPYLDYDKVKAIFKHRDTKGMIKNWAQLQAVTKNAGELNPMLESYVKF